MTGTCFEDAAYLAVDPVGFYEGGVLVHGLPVGQGEHNAGRRYWHAWVEYPGPGGVTWVSDPSQDLTCPRSVYYFLADIGAVEGNRVWRYTPEEARGEMLRTGHYGPWVDGWEEMGL